MFIVLGYILKGWCLASGMEEQCSTPLFGIKARLSMLFSNMFNSSWESSFVSLEASAFTLLLQRNRCGSRPYYTITHNFNSKKSSLRFHFNVLRNCQTGQIEKNVLWAMEQAASDAVSALDFTWQYHVQNGWRTPRFTESTLSRVKQVEDAQDNMTQGNALIKYTGRNHVTWKIGATGEQLARFSGYMFHPLYALMFVL